MTDDLTPEALDALTALDQAATPGPWEADPVVVRGNGGRNAVCDTRGSQVPTHNAALIAAMRNALPALIAAARERDELQAEVKSIRFAVAATSRLLAAYLPEKP